MVAYLLAGDAILNYRTVAGLGNEDIIIEQYDKYLDTPVKKASKRAHYAGIAFGFS